MRYLLSQLAAYARRAGFHLVYFILILLLGGSAGLVMTSLNNQNAALKAQIEEARKNACVAVGAPEMGQVFEVTGDNILGLKLGKGDAVPTLKTGDRLVATGDCITQDGGKNLRLAEFTLRGNPEAGEFFIFASTISTTMRPARYQ